MNREEAIQILETQFPHDSVIREALATVIPEFRERIEYEGMLDSVIHIITHLDDLAHEPTYAGPKWTHPYTKEIAWLKSLRSQKKDDLKWRRIRTGERIPCNAYLYNLAYERKNNFGGKTTIDGYLVPNIEGLKCGCDTWYLPVEAIKNLPKEDEK